MLRGVAVVMMVAFHACFDLTYFGFAHFRMLEDPFWTTWRTVIVSCFVFLAGVSQSLSLTSSQRGFYTRLAQVGGCAALVSLVTLGLFGTRWIYFGVLHFFALAAVLTRPVLSRPAVLVWGGLGLLVLAQGLSSPVMDPRTLNWIGLAAHKPFTEDYAPLIPWLGVYWLGAWFQQRFPHWADTPSQLLQPAHPSIPSQPSIPAQPARPSQPAQPAQPARPSITPKTLLSLLGRHGLLVYMLHQPLLFGVMALASVMKI